MEGNGDHVTKNELPEVEAVRIRKEVVEKLRPHFVFNTMNVLRYLVRTDPDTAYTALYDLARFMQGNIEKAFSGGRILLREELNFACSYLNLEQIQRRKLTVKWNIQDEEGYIARGSISTAVAEIFRNDPEIGRQERTLSVEKLTKDENIKIFVDETGVEVEIPVSGRDDN